MKFAHLNSVPLAVAGRDADETDVDLVSVNFRSRRFVVHVVHAQVKPRQRP